MNRNACGLVGLLVVAASLLGGCTSGPAKYNVNVTPAAGLREGGRFPSFEVDVVGVNQTEADQLRAYPLNSWFSGSDAMRKDMEPRTMSFTAAASGPQKLESKDPVWDKWLARGATQVAVMTNIPGAGDERRRLILPLASGRWEGRDLEIEVQRSGVVCRTPMKPE